MPVCSRKSRVPIGYKAAGSVSEAFASARCNILTAWISGTLR